MIGIRSENGLLFRKFITLKISFFMKNKHPRTVQIMKYSTNEADPSSLRSDGIKIRKISRHIKNIMQYFEGNKWIKEVDNIPKRILKRTKSKSPQLYLFDNNTADQFLDLIKDDLLKRPKKIIEINPGIGVLTEKLLKAGIPFLNVMEPCIKFMQRLVHIQQKYPKRMLIQEASVFTIWDIAGQDIYDDGNRVQQLFSNFKQIKWGKKPGLKIIGAVPTINFIRHLMMDVVKQSGIASYGRPYLYLCVPPSIWLRLTCDGSAGLNEYRNTSVLFQILFDSKLLGKVPRKSFLPWMPNYTEKQIPELSKYYFMDKDEFFVVRIEGRENLFTEIVNKKHIQYLWHFINHHMMIRRGRIIPSMETWQSGCGPKLIKLDYDMFTQFGDLTPQDIVKLFNEFTSWDGFHNAFVPSFESSLRRMEQLLF